MCLKQTISGKNSACAQPRIVHWTKRDSCKRKERKCSIPQNSHKNAKIDKNLWKDRVRIYI